MDDFSAHATQTRDGEIGQQTEPVSGLLVSLFRRGAQSGLLPSIGFSGGFALTGVGVFSGDLALTPLAALLVVPCLWKGLSGSTWQDTLSQRFTQISTLGFMTLATLSACNVKAFTEAAEVNPAPLRPSASVSNALRLPITAPASPLGLKYTGFHPAKK